MVEQTPARQDGFPESLIEGADNLVRISTLKHWEITGWFMTPNEDFHGLSRGEYLSGKEWAERQRIGLEAPAYFGVLIP